MTSTTEYCIRCYEEPPITGGLYCESCEAYNAREAEKIWREAEKRDELGKSGG